MKNLIFALFLTTAFPAISQSAADSVKVARLDLVSAAEELEDFDQLKVEAVLLYQIIGTYKTESTALQLQNSAKDAQIDLLRQAYKTLQVQNKATEAQGKGKFTLLDALLIGMAFLAGGFITAL